MIILKTNLELKLTYDRLIKTMQVPVEWNGNFVIVGDYLILHGRVRSLFFNFENRKVVTNIIDIPFQKEDVVEIGNNMKIQNVLNLALYGFGKWGSIKGIKVEQDYAQLNNLFHSVLREISVEPGYSKENFRFYKEGIRVNYEDVIQFAIEASEDKIEEEPKEEDEAGLWHKLVWKKKKTSFGKTETTFEQRQKQRLGNNFYMVGCQCPKCRDNLHMVVFPEDEAFRIETEEGGVLLARAYTCDNCNCFYTPRPEKLLMEGDVYVMDFFSDRRAYEDYLELLGQSGDRVSNYKFNEFESARKRRKKKEKAEESLEEICEKIDEFSDAELAEVLEKIESGFYPSRSVKQFEHMVHREVNTRKKKKELEKEAAHRAEKKASERAAEKHRSLDVRKQFEDLDVPSPLKDTDEKQPVKTTGIFQASKPAFVAAADTEDVQKKATEDKKEHVEQQTEETCASEMSKEPVAKSARQEAVKKRYMAKFGVLDRLSPAQVSELRGQLERETNLHETDRQDFLEKITQKEQQQKKERIHQLAESGRNQNYARIQHIIDEIQAEDLPEEEKKELLLPLYEQKRRRGEAEVRQFVEKMSPTMDLTEYRAFKDKLQSYSEVDLSPYEAILEERKQQAEEREITNMVRHSRTNDRQGIVELMERLSSQNFDGRILQPYMDKLTERLRSMDEDAIAEICGNPMQMTADEAMRAYQQIEQGPFLPELKTNALEMLNKRLMKLKTDECELLVQKLKEGMSGRIKENDRYHFYPARKVMMQEAKPEETKVIDYALDTYGTKRGIFEYPILVIDTSRNHSGKEGMILTSEHLFYRTLMNAYMVSVFDIRRVRTQTGLLNAGLFIELADGRKIKIPYAVDRKELSGWGSCLREFIQYLQEKPDSRKLTYLAKEKHETICCFRCGYSYQGGQICPKCGYKMNQ